MTENIDTTDAKILSLLQKDGRITNSSLSLNINLSTAATLERVRKLEIKKVIKGYQTLLDPKKVGLDFCFFAKIKLKNPTKNNLSLFSKFVSKIPYISSLYQIVGGGWHFFIKGAVKNCNIYSEKVINSLYESEMISEIDDEMILNCLKEEGFFLESK